jgi:hypothetical protein
MKHLETKPRCQTLKRKFMLDKKLWKYWNGCHFNYTGCYILLNMIVSSKILQNIKSVCGCIKEL